MSALVTEEGGQKARIVHHWSSLLAETEGRPPPPPPPPPPPEDKPAPLPLKTSFGKPSFRRGRGGGNRRTTVGFDPSANNEKSHVRSKFNRKKIARQSMIVRPGEARRRSFRFDGGQKEELRSIFTLLDTDMDGRLLPNEVYVAMAAVGVTPTQEIKRAIQKRLPRTAATEGVEFHMFERIIKSTLTAQPVQRKDLQMLLDLYDTTGTGRVKGS